MMDKLILKKEDTILKSDGRSSPWKILVVDDEEGVHQVTTLALKNFIFDNKNLQLFHAYSAAQALEYLIEHPDTAIVLLDVVMESEHAGLKLVKKIREDLNNKTSRIVLRTGQPGQAPEREVIQNYDINGYKTKTELTANKLFTLMYATLRSYRDIITLERSRKGLEKLIVASRGISSRVALAEFIRVTVEQLTHLLNIEDTTIFSCKVTGYVLLEQCLEVYSPENPLGSSCITVTDLPEGKRDIISSAITEQKNIFEKDKFVVYCANKNQIVLFFAQINQVLSDLDIRLLNIFTENLIVTLDNIQLNEAITDSQKEMVYRLGEVVESRSKETGNHVKRMAHYSELLALLVGLDKTEAELIKTASPMHDIGKIAIPDAILTKPGKLNAEEWQIVKTHPKRGYEILKQSSLAVMNISAIIALTHHEKWDGTGYPKGEKGTDIHIYGRITAIADVFDALGSERCYKEAWPLDKIIALFKSERGKHFDPLLTDLFLENLDKFLVIRDKFID
nr:HD domain-containing phosphohydrolase [uncultured Desulfobacter sp.]